MKPGEWLQWRRDSQRTGRSGIPGRIRQPAIIAEHSLGGVQDWLVFRREGAGASPLILAGDGDGLDAAVVRRDWELDRWLDVEGSGCLEPVVESHRERYVQLQVGSGGYQRLFFESAFDLGMQGERTRGWLEQPGPGGSRRLWTTPPDRDYWQPNILFADIDGDGREEIVLAAHYRLMAFDPETGAKIRELRYHDYRNYGEIHAVDLTGNGVDDFIQLVEFPAHVEVLLNDGNAFALAWLEDIQHGDICDSEHMLSTPYYPVADVDGDGELEVVYSRYNESGDGRWHTLAVHALTGRRVLDLPDFVVKDIVTCTPSAPPWMFGIRSCGRLVPPDGAAAVYAGNRIVWEDPDVAWCFWRPYPWTNLRSSKVVYRGERSEWKEKLACTDGGRTVWCRQSSSPDASLHRLCACRIADGHRQVLAQATLPDFAVQAVRPESGELLVTTRRAAGEFQQQSRGLSWSLLGSQALREPVHAPVVFQTGDARPAVVVPDLLGNIQCIDLTHTRQPCLRWMRRGYGMLKERGVCAARGSRGERCVVFVVPNREKGARVIQVDASGGVVWAHDLPATHATMQPNRDQAGGMAYWQTLPLRGHGCDDVAVTAQKGNMHSGFTCALAGPDGSLIWRRDRSGRAGNETRGFGGGEYPFAGLPGDDGAEDLVSEFPDLLYVADGATGEVAVHLRSQFGSFFVFDAQAGVLRSAPVFYGTPVVVPQGVLWGGCPWIVGLWQNSAYSPGFRWFTSVRSSSYTDSCPLQAIGDFGGDGVLSVVGWEPAKGMLACRDLESGDLRWTLALAGADRGQYFATCDIDGDGREECLLCTDGELVAIGERESEGSVVWRLPLPAPCTQPVVADVDGDGLAEILLPCEDGVLRLVSDSRRTEDPTARRGAED